MVRSENISLAGYLFMMAGAALIVITGIFFYQYFQSLLASSSTSGTPSSLTNALAIYNGTADTPIFVAVGFLGLGSFIAGAVFVAGGHVGEQITGKIEVGNSSAPVSVISTTGLKACVKCGTILNQNTAYCPNCGAALARTQAGSPSAT
jgi:zinc ribbon protein